MSIQSGIKIIARHAMVGIAGLNSRTGQDGGRMDGSASAVLGTSSQYDTSRYIPTQQIYASGGRLRDELKALWNNDAIHIEIDGRRITAIGEFLAIGEPATYLRRQSVFLPATVGFTAISGTYAETYDGSQRRYQRRTAADAAHVFLIEVPPEVLTRDGEGGFMPVQFDICYGITTAILDDIEAAVYKSQAPATGVQMAAAAAYTTTYDAAHDTTAERNTVAFHTMEVTIADAELAWLVAGDSIFVEVAVDGSAAGVLDYYGCEVHYRTRPGIAQNSDDT